MAVVSDSGNSISYANLWEAAAEISKQCLGPSLEKRSIALNVTDPVNFTTCLLAVWMNESIAVPLHHSYPQNEIEHRLSTTRAKITLEHDSNGKLQIQKHSNSDDDPFNLPSDSNLVLFTSGSTGKPKGVVHTQSSLAHQLADLQKAWHMSPTDHLLHTLPLNHIHGLVTGLLNSLWNGSSITIHSKFEAEAVHAELFNNKDITFFTAVPTIYSRLYSLLIQQQQQKAARYSHLRAMISGSSALPLRLKESEAVLGLTITERYGMTETGMITSNELGKKSSGVGKPLASVQVEAKIGEIGDIYVKGPGLFAGYLRDGRFEPHPENYPFRTGDQGFFVDQSRNSLQLSGRDRDIFKVSGFKVAAGEIESALSEHEAVVECVACALSERQDSSSQIIAVVVRVKDSKTDATQLKDFLTSKLAYYKVPRKWIVSESVVIPRNMLGKPDITAIKALF